MPWKKRLSTMGRRTAVSRIRNGPVGIATLSLALLAAVAGPGCGLAAAADRVPVGGGAGIGVNGDTFCTLTTIGNDSAGDLVGFTSARCGAPGAAVTVPGGGKVGTIVGTVDQLDYAIIKFDPAKVNPVANFQGFAINGISSDASRGQYACRLSRGSGHTCFSVGPPAMTVVPPLFGGPVESAPGVITGFSADSPDGAWWQPDDGGAPVTVNGLLIGMVRDSFNPWPPLNQPRITVVTITTILDDTNARGGIGAGFTPVPV